MRVVILIEWCHDGRLADGSEDGREVVIWYFNLNMLCWGPDDDFITW